MDDLYRAWEAETVEHPVYGNCPIGEILSLIYADDDQLSAMDREWLQQALNVLVGMFERMGLKVNIAKTKFMICLPSSHHSHISVDAYKRKMTGEGETYRERKHRRVQCPECEAQLSASYLPTHLRMQHQICWPILDHGPSPLNEAPADWWMSCPKALKIHKCPVPNCCGKTRTPYGMRLHYFKRHPNTTICILEEGSNPIKKCPKCKMHVGHLALNRRHLGSKLCRDNQETNRIRKLELAKREAQDAIVTIHGIPLEQVHSHLDLGRVFADVNDDFLAVWHNLAKGKVVWGNLSRVLSGTGVPPKTQGYFFKCVAGQTIFFGSESWTEKPSIIDILTRFIVKVARRITGNARLLPEWRVVLAVQN